MSEGNEGIGPEAEDPASSSKSDSKERISLRVSLFFDGTGNNRVNTTERLKDTAIYEKFGKGDTSYANDYSNVSRLEAHVQQNHVGDDIHISVYTEGIGTVDREADHTFPGKAMGRGSTGVFKKVEKGILQALGKISQKVRKAQPSKNSPSTPSVSVVVPRLRAGASIECSMKRARREPGRSR